MSNPSSEAVPNRLAAPVPLNGTHPVSDWAWAQARVNFVIVGPRTPSPWRIVDPTIRGESPAAHSTIRYFLEDARGRRLRAKQYFNDWWIPTVADISFRGPGRAITAGEGVAFVGRDYRRHEASCGHRYGTNVEFSAESGALDDAAWVSLWTGLDALDPPAVAEARAGTFARRNYWNRWRRTHAPWDTSEISSLAWSDPTTAAMDRAAWALTADRWAPLPGTVDSLGFRSGPLGEEAQFAFRWPLTLNCSAWLRALKDPGDDWRPLVDGSEVNRPHWSKAEVAGRPVERAAMDSKVGNWYYAWRDGARAMELHLRAAPGLTQARADAVVGALLA